MSEDHTGRVQGLKVKLAIAAAALIKIYATLPVPITITLGSQPEIVAIDLIHAAEILKDMPGIPAAAERALRHATWCWVSAVYITAWFQAVGGNGPDLCATYILLECGTAMRTTLDELEGRGDTETP